MAADSPESAWVAIQALGWTLYKQGYALSRVYEGPAERRQGRGAGDARAEAEAGKVVLAPAVKNFVPKLPKATGAASYRRATGGRQRARGLAARRAPAYGLNRVVGSGGPDVSLAPR